MELWNCAIMPLWHYEIEGGQFHNGIMPQCHNASFQLVIGHWNWILATFLKAFSIGINPHELRVKCYNVRMPIRRHIAILLTAVAAVVLARTLTVSLPPVAHADTETVANVPLAASLDTAGRFAFSLTCIATPTNNVEVAFGRDANGNGALDVDEIERVVGWDCGAWFTRSGADGEYITAETCSSGETRTISWELKTSLQGAPSRLSVVADGMTVFSELSIADGYSPTWNMMRLVGRGLDASQENFSVTVSPDGTTIFMR